MIITDSGTVIRIPLNQVSTLRRSTQGLRLIRLRDDQLVANVTLVKIDETDDNNNDMADNVDVDN